MKSSAYLPSIENPLYGLPLPLQENLDPPSIIFEKSQPTLQIGGEEFTPYLGHFKKIFLILKSKKTC